MSDIEASPSRSSERRYRHQAADLDVAHHCRGFDVIGELYTCPGRRTVGRLAEMSCSSKRSGGRPRSRLR